MFLDITILAGNCALSALGAIKMASWFINILNLIIVG